MKFIHLLLGIAISTNTYSQAVSRTVEQVNQVVGQAAQTKRTVKDITGQSQREREAQYTAQQELDNIKFRLTELNGTFYDLDHRIELVENTNKQIDTENDRLYKRIYALEQETERLKAENETYKRSFSEVVERLNRLEFSTIQASTLETSEIITTPTKTQKSSSTRSYTPKSSQYYIRGPRGGCYYINSNGNKTYVDRSLCN